MLKSTIRNIHYIIYIYHRIADAKANTLITDHKDTEEWIMDKKRIAVIFGGKSSEHEVSRVSASYVISQIPTEKYEIVTIGITKTGRWFLYTGALENIADGTWEKDENNRTAFIAPAPSVHGIIIINKDGTTEKLPLDVVFPVLHGKNGEDGTLQGLLEMSEIPYVGCGVLASAECMDKVSTNIMFEHAGIDQAKFTWFYSYEYEENAEKCIAKAEAELPEYPLFVKPANAGSSVGISKAHNRDELIKAIEKAAKEDSRILIEESIVGKEVECAVLGNKDPFVSIPGQIAPAAEFYDYDAKYNNAESKLFIPAHISDELAEKVRKTAAAAYTALGCEGLSRVDFFVTDEGRILLNEINTLPGFTSISMYPKLMAASGIDGSELIEKLISLAFERAGKNV